MVKTVEEKLKELVVEKLAEPGFEDYFLIEIQVGGTKVEVFIDSDTSVQYDKCKKVSRALEAFLDESKALGEKYTLDVSSAGVGKPLVMARQYLKNIGRDLEVKKADGTSVTGQLLKATENDFTIESDIIEKEGKKKVKKKVTETFPYDEINKAIVKIRF